MPTLGDRFRAFAKPVPRKTIDNLADYIPPKNTRMITGFSKTVRRVPYRNLYQLYRIDGVLFGLVNKFATNLTKGDFMVEGGKDEYRKEIEAWISRRSTNFIPNLTLQLVEVAINGTGFAEYVLADKMDDILFLNVIPGDDIEVKVDTSGQVKLDTDGNPIDLLYTGVDGNQRKVTKDKVFTVKMFGPEAEFLGQSPLETIYKPSLIKLNIEEALGQSIFRHGFPISVLSVGDEEHEVSAEGAKKLHSELKNISERDEWIIPYWWKFELLKGEQLQGITEHLEYFSNVQFSAFAIPRATVFQTQMGRIGGAFQVILTEYEDTYQALQVRLCKQIQEQLFPQILLTRGKVREREELSPEDIPTCRFKPTVQSQKLNKARRIAILARAGVITWDAGLENFLRKEEELPERDPNAPPPQPPNPFGQPPFGQQGPGQKPLPKGGKGGRRPPPEDVGEGSD